MLRKFPKLKSYEMFELLARDVMQIKLGTILSLYGRNGQKQNGIDLYTSGENRIVVQCKDYLSNKSSDEINKVFLNELGKTKLLDFTFDQFWLVTALDRDTSIQNIVENMQDQYAGTIYRGNFVI